MHHPALIILAAYGLGCFSTGYYLVRLVTGRDLRRVASGNVGSRNAGRILGAKGFLLTFLGDAGKGMLAVWLARQAGAGPVLTLVALLAVTVGHIWPVQLRFRGGKGLATLAGGLAVLQPAVLLMGLLLIALLYPLWRRTQPVGLIALACTPFLMCLVLSLEPRPSLSAELGVYALLVTLVLYAHRSNLRSEFFGTFTKGDANVELASDLQDCHGTGRIRTDPSPELSHLCRGDSAAPAQSGAEAD